MKFQVVPNWLEENPGKINTGNDVVDQVLTVMLTTSMFVAGVLGFFLDNTIPGSLEERGVAAWRAQTEITDDKNDLVTVGLNTYDIPFVTKYLKRYLPLV